jgi:hypothetical protein
VERPILAVETNMKPNPTAVAFAVAAALSVFCTVSEAEAAPRKAELLRTWQAEGSDTHGDYTGTIVVTSSSRWRVELDAKLNYADGSERSWTSSSGYYVFGRIYCRYQIASGAVGHLAGLGNVEVRGTLIPNNAATEISGSYRANGFEATETLNRIGHGYRWSSRVLERVMARNGLTDQDELIAEAIGHDDGNHYLKTSEFEAAAAALSSAIAIISDIDKTILPPGEPMGAPYPGVSTLYAELGSDISYVTARQPPRVVNIPDWLDDHGLPAGPIETGVSGIPWVAEPEKVRDIKSLLAANPGKRFVMLGDTSQRDAEAYQTIKAEFPDRIAAVIIHQVTSSMDPARVAGMHLVVNYAEAAAALHHDGLLTRAAARRVMEAARAEGLALTDAEMDTLLDN